MSKNTQLVLAVAGGILLAGVAQYAMAMIMTRVTAAAKGTGTRA